MVDYSIVIIGFTGVGKSTIAQGLSRELDLELIDTDKLIEEKMKMSVAEVFKKHGEENFREIEVDVIKSIKGKKGKVISCGGGACLREENIINIKSSNKVVLLESSIDEILKRLNRNLDRPVFKGNMDKESIEEYIDKRRENYHKAADVIINTLDKSESDIIIEIKKRLNL